MNLIKSAVTAALVAGLSFAGAQSANASVVYAGQYTYLGGFTTPPGTPSSEVFSRTATVANAPVQFDDFYVFNLNPAALTDVSANFTPLGAFTGFTGGLYHASGFTCGVAGTACTPGVVGSLIHQATGGAIFAGFEELLTAGQYAVRIQGTVSTNGDRLYSGQVAFQTPPTTVPEPTSMVLLGMGLLGAGIARRRR